MVDLGQYGYSGRSRKHLPEQDHALAGELIGNHRHASDVAAGSSEVLDKPMSDRVVTTERHDDRDGRGRLLGCPDGRRAHGGDYVRTHSDQLGRKCGKSVEPAVGQAYVQHEILPFNIAQLAQPLPESLKDTACCREIAHTVHLATRLRRSSDRGGEEAASDHAKERSPLDQWPHPVAECRALRSNRVPLESAQRIPSTLIRRSLS